MPHRVSVKCPGCGGLAQFEFAQVVKIQRVMDIEYFKQSEAFEYRFLEDSGGQRWHGAIYYHGLKGNRLASISDLPDGYLPEHWNHGRYLYRSHTGDLGSVLCGDCSYREKHDLKWPQDAYFQIDYKGKALWAFDRESASELLDYIRSEDRKRQRYKWRSFLRHVPSHFLRKGARETVSKKLSNLVSGVGKDP